MRLLLFSAALCLCVLYVQCVPIQKESAAVSPAAVLEEGKKQEETQGVFIKPTAEPKPAEVKESAPSAPVETKVEAKPEKLKETGRQGTEDDDDDDDDDDDLDLGVDDGDDDDDDEDESPAAASDDDDDDDDDDYFDSFFDDILGEDDDDDDEEEDDVAPAAPQPADSVPEAPVQESEFEQAAEEGTGETDNPLGEEQSDSLVDKDPTDVAASSVNQQQVVVQPVADDDAEDDDDDDDDEDEIEGELDDLAGGSDDDDDDDDDATDDDDDDDDEDDLEDVIEARSRSLQITKPNQTRMPSIYISKYNRFVDNILGRINRILGKSYDPVRVKLQSGETKSKKKTPSKPNTSSKKKGTKKRLTRITNKMGNLDVSRATHKMGDAEIARSTESESREPAFVLIAKTGDTKAITPIKNVTLEVRANPTTAKKTKKTKTKSKPTKASGTKTKTSKQVSKARATLFGLSTLRREGDVVVNMMSDYTSVKTNFLLGPLTLRVEKEFGRGAKREVKSATATTAEMFGKLNLRIVHGGAATLHSIKVLQPKQVRVDSADNHEKTKQYMWRRSSHIASVVSKKLASAARSMLKPPPNES